MEDSDDTRLLLAVALGHDGWTVDEAADAFAALDLLRHHHYDVLLTDYDLPGKTGAVMIREAIGESLLEETRVVVVTAHPEPVGIEDLEVIRKPLDLTQFLKQMRGKHPAGEMAGPSAAAPVLELVLYVSAHSLASARAEQAVRSLISEDRSDVHLTVCDLALHPDAGEEDNIVFTPTLVKREPPPRAWILGDLTRSETLDDLLRTFGVTSGTSAL